MKVFPHYFITMNCVALIKTFGTVPGTGQYWILQSVLFPALIQAPSRIPSMCAFVFERMKLARFQLSQLWYCRQNGWNNPYIFNVENEKATKLSLPFLLLGGHEEPHIVLMRIWVLTFPTDSALSFAARTTYLTLRVSFFDIDYTELIVCLQEAYPDVNRSIQKVVRLPNRIFEVLQKSALPHDKIAVLCKQKRSVRSKCSRRFEWGFTIFERNLIVTIDRHKFDVDNAKGGTT